MLVLFFLLFGACACSVAVVKSLNMGNRTDTHTLLHTARRQGGVWSSIFSAAWRLLGYLKVLSRPVFNIIHEGLLFWSGVTRSSARLWRARPSADTNACTQRGINKEYSHSHASMRSAEPRNMSLVCIDFQSRVCTMSSHSWPTAVINQTSINREE